MPFEIGSMESVDLAYEEPPPSSILGALPPATAKSDAATASTSTAAAAASPEERSSSKTISLVTPSTLGNLTSQALFKIYGCITLERRS